MAESLPIKPDCLYCPSILALLERIDRAVAEKVFVYRQAERHLERGRHLAGLIEEFSTSIRLEHSFNPDGFDDVNPDEKLATLNAIEETTGGAFRSIFNDQLTDADEIIAESTNTIGSLQAGCRQGLILEPQFTIGPLSFGPEVPKCSSDYRAFAP